jgi:hypothetical protein
MGTPPTLAWLTPARRARATAVVLLLLVFWAYRPALQHVPREDQWSFLLDTVHEERFWPMLAGCYSYNRTREISPGDYPLFRPVLFATLCAEKALFGHRYFYWQATGIALHAAVVLVLLSLLLCLHRLRPCTSPGLEKVRLLLAYGLALFFGVNFAGAEMVFWCHIHGYLLYALCVLGGLRLLAAELCGALPAGGWFWRRAGAWALTLLAAFSYETGSVYAALVGAALGLAAAARRQTRQGVLLFALFATILPLYRAADRLDQLSHPNAQPDVTAATVLDQARLGPTLHHARRFALFTLFQPFFPSCPEWSFNGRLCIPEPGTTPWRYWRHDPLLGVSWAVVLAGACLGLCHLGRALCDRQGRSVLPFLVVLLGLFLLHLAIIVLGRMNLRPGRDVLATSSYYAYTPLAALLLVLYIVWSGPPLPSRASAVALAVVLAGVVVLALCSAGKVRAMANRIRVHDRTLRAQINLLQALIDRHGQHPNYGVSFDPRVFDSLASCHGVSLLEILFCRYLDHQHPTHVVCLDGAGKWTVLGAEEYRARYGGPHHRRLPRFVRPGTEYMVFEHQGRYFGLRFWEGRFFTDRHGYHHLLRGASVDEVLAQVPAALHRRVAPNGAPKSP